MIGIITIAVGDTVYGKLAANLAISIKHKSDVQMCVIYTPSAFRGQEYLLDLFEYKHLICDTDNPKLLSMQLKVDLNLRSPFGETLFLDADTIICPTHSVWDWLDELVGVQFTAYNNSISRLSDKPYEHYRSWADPKYIADFYELEYSRNIPQINSSFLYWENSYITDNLFSKARMVMNSAIKHDLWRGEFPDELAFNVACCITGVLPHKETYRPIYLYILSETISKEYILDNFAGLSVIGDVKDGRVIQYYNDFVDYYCDMAGIRIKNYYEPKIKDKTDRRIFGFYHIYAVNNYQQIVNEQITALIDSGLYSASEKIYVVVSGGDIDLRKYPKMQIVSRVEPNTYEFPTIELIKRHSETDENQYYYYLHTKGVSYPDGRCDYWREYMMYYNIAKWRDCVDKLKDGYETCGVKLSEANKLFPKHYSGNFWWAKSEYIKRCPTISKLNNKDRFQAEFWVCMGNPNAATLCQVYIDENQKPPYK